MAAKRTREDKDQKEKVILRLLEEGHSTEEIAQRLGYKDRDSVGKYMRRRGYKWNEEEKTYQLPEEGKEGNKDHTDNIDTDNIAANHATPGNTKKRRAQE